MDEKRSKTATIVSLVVLVIGCSLAVWYHKIWPGTLIALGSAIVIRKLLFPKRIPFCVELKRIGEVF